MGPTWSCRPQMGPMLAPWTLLSGESFRSNSSQCLEYRQLDYHNILLSLHFCRYSFSRISYIEYHQCDDGCRVKKYVHCIRKCHIWYNEHLLHSSWTVNHQVSVVSTYWHEQFIRNERNVVMITWCTTYDVFICTDIIPLVLCDWII